MFDLVEDRIAGHVGNDQFQARVLLRGRSPADLRRGPHEPFRKGRRFARRGRRAVDLTVHPVPGLGFPAGLGGKPAARQGRHRRLLQADGGGPAGNDLQPLRLSREHVHQHAEINGLARPAGPQHGDHFRPFRLPQGLIGQGHRRAAAAAILGVACIRSLTYEARDRHRGLCQFARFHRLQHTAGHTRTVSHAVGSASARPSSPPTMGTWRPDSG